MSICQQYLIVPLMHFFIYFANVIDFEGSKFQLQNCFCCICIGNASFKTDTMDLHFVVHTKTAYDLLQYRSCIGYSLDSQNCPYFEIADLIFYETEFHKIMQNI